MRYNLLEVLETNRFLYDMLRECPYEILRQIEVRSYGPGEFVLHQGHVYDTLYIIVRGSVEIFVESTSGKRYHLSTYERGRFIGELEVFRELPYVSSVVSDKEIVLLEIRRSLLFQWLEMDKHFSGILIRSLCDEAYEMCRNMAENTLYSLKQRVIQYLLTRSDKEGRFVSEVRTERIGEVLAVTQRSVNRILKELREKELISVDKQGAHILDYEGLVLEMEE